MRAVPAVEPSSDFVVRLHHRLYEAEEEWRLQDRRQTSAASASVVVTLAFALGAAAWIPTLRHETPTLQLTPVLAVAPEAEPHPLFRAGPLLSARSGPPVTHPVATLASARRTAFGAFAAYEPPVRLLGR